MFLSTFSYVPSLPEGPTRAESATFLLATLALPITIHRWLRSDSMASRCSVVSNRVCRRPCGKQHLREIATPDWVRTLRRFDYTHLYARFVNWPTQSGVAISRKCCFPHCMSVGVLEQLGHVLPLASGGRIGPSHRHRVDARRTLVGT